MTARCIMVLGTTSGAGKSWLATALCRWYSQRGYRVAPFKAQNMSNNARVVARASSGGYGEIGSAQYFQALAANVLPDVRMNPLLLKPEADTHSQVVLMGEVNLELTKMPWRERSEAVWPFIVKALDELRAQFDIVIIEGAGSPAEINLHSSDIVNMRVALHAQAQCLLVTDIDRGGAFAHLYGTWALLPEIERNTIQGFVLNKFRGDAKLLAPAPQMLADLTGIPTVATLPMWWKHGLPEEDGVFDSQTISSGIVHTSIAVIAFPRMSNLDEFQTLKNIDGVRLTWARAPADLLNADVIILPGSKQTGSDLAWMKRQQLDIAVQQHAADGKRVLGICGGLQMLGDSLLDPLGVDGVSFDNVQGLRLLAVSTQFEKRKTVIPTQTQFASLPGLWAPLSNVCVEGYEIHNGQTSVGEPNNQLELSPIIALGNNLGWCNVTGNVLGIYVHGIFENDTVLRALFGAQVTTLDSVFDGLAEFIDEHFEAGLLVAFTEPQP